MRQDIKARLEELECATDRFSDQQLHCVAISYTDQKTDIIHVTSNEVKFSGTRKEVRQQLSKHFKIKKKKIHILITSFDSTKTGEYYEEFKSIYNIKEDVQLDESDIPVETK